MGTGLLTDLIMNIPIIGKTLAYNFLSIPTTEEEFLDIMEKKSYQDIILGLKEKVGFYVRDDRENYSIFLTMKSNELYLELYDKNKVDSLPFNARDKDAMLIRRRKEAKETLETMVGRCGLLNKNVKVIEEIIKEEYYPSK